MTLCYFSKDLYHQWISGRWSRMDDLLYQDVTLSHWTGPAVNVHVCVAAWWYDWACTAVELVCTEHLFRSATLDWAADRQCTGQLGECSLGLRPASDRTGSCEVWTDLKWLQHAWPCAVLGSTCHESTHCCWMSLWSRWTSCNIGRTASATQYRATICLWYHCSGGGYQSGAGSFLCTGPCWNWKDLLMDSTVLSILFTGQSDSVHCFIWHCILTSAWRFNCSLLIQHSIELYIYKYIPNIHSISTCSLALYCISDHLGWSADAAQIQLNDS